MKNQGLGLGLGFSLWSGCFVAPLYLFLYLENDGNNLALIYLCTWLLFLDSDQMDVQ